MVFIISVFENNKIGLLGGSFNPAHDGHREISIAALDILQLDFIWWLVSPANPLKDPATYAPYAQRCAHAQSIADHSKIMISDFEYVHNLQYTVDTVKKIQDYYRKATFVWLMGADSFAGFHLWRDWQEITTSVPIAVFNRPGYQESMLSSESMKKISKFQHPISKAPALVEQKPPAWIFVPYTENSLSSTQIRKAGHDDSQALHSVRDSGKG